MSCGACGTEDPPEGLLASCDRCAAVFCRSCSGLGSTEMRAAAMKKRSLVFLCPGCQPCRQMFRELTAFGSTLMEQLREEISALAAPLEQKISAVSDEVSVLRQSNMDLVKLLTNFPPSKDLTRPTETSQRKFSDVKDHERSGEGLSPPATEVSALKTHVRASAPDIAGSSSRSSKPQSQLSRSPTVDDSAAFSSRKTTRKTRPPAIIGSCKIKNTQLSAATIRKKTSIFVSRLDTRVSKEDLTGYLRATFGATEIFVVEEQRVKSGDYRSYRVEANLELLDRLLCADNWPENVLVRKFRFPRSVGGEQVR